MTCGKYEQDFFRRHARNGNINILKNSAHLSWFEQPERYSELITDFINQIKP